jgi:hypothetical protein
MATITCNARCDNLETIRRWGGGSLPRQDRFIVPVKPGNIAARAVLRCCEPGSAVRLSQESQLAVLTNAGWLPE